MLYEVSTTMETWQQGKYGRCLSFCDCATLADKGAESTRFRGRFQSALDKARAKRQNLANLNQSRINAASKYRTTELKADIRSCATYPNPAFLTRGDSALIHYGLDPLLGFHLTAVDAPLDSTTNFVNRLPRHEKYAALAQAENDVKYRNRYGVRPLMLDGPDYAPRAQGPVEFDVIDTSNLCNHLGSLTLLTATSPLLRDNVSAVLYTKVLAKNHKDYQEVLDQVLCGHVPTLSTLLGLFPKRALCIGSTTTTTTPLPPNIPIWFDPKLLAKTLYGVYVHMFLDKDWAHRLSNLSLEAIRKSSLVYTMDLIKGRSNAPMGINYYQELNVYLHILGVYSTDVMKSWSKRDGGPILTPFVSSVRPADKKRGDLQDWKNIPPVVCVTLRIPHLKQLGTPPVHCLLQGSGVWGRSGWQNIFPACQLSFGEVSTLGKPYDDSYEISVQKDDAGWSRKSPLIASFFATTFPLLQQPRDVLVALRVHNSPATVADFLPKLGFTLNVYETTLDDSDAVHVTRFAPNQNGFPIVSRFTRIAPASDIRTRAETSLTAVVDQKTGAMTSLVGRLDIMSSDLKQTLTSRCEVKQLIMSPREVAISLGRNPPLGLCFPVSIKQSCQKLRIARKSSYIEVVAQVADCSEWMAYPEYMFPVHAQPGKPKCPWLVSHLSLAMSARERALRENVRLDFRESIFSIFVQFAGLQGTKSRVFCLNNAAHGGVHVVILASALRLDLANRAVMLDCAVLPLHDALMPDVMGSLAKLQGFGVVVVKVNDAELRLWRQALPAYVERCRNWTHRDNCKYAISGSIPLYTRNGKRVLCSCGNGKFPPNFISNVPGWTGLSKYAAPFAEDMYSPDLGNLGKKEVANVKKTFVDGRCASYGKNKQADGGGLLNCARCIKVKYCSRECQRMD
ncbi:hypothetical protein F5Y08DRAFT_332439 [Xylaria arbuscula]|nr:hypothetical protein F5Y08DRAFT_332439 [Xylaria arbuscula]